MQIDPNRDQLIRVARALGHMRDEVVFLGGAVVGLLLTDAAAPPIRRTKDVDLIVEVISHHDYAMVLGPRLRDAGFREHAGIEDEATPPLCRWALGDLIVDVMPTNEAVLGFSNRWYPKALATALRHTLRDITIRAVSAPCFLATKLEAFRNRGNGDFAASHDIEDVLAVVNARGEVVDEVLGAPDDVRDFVASEFSNMLGDRAFLNVCEGIVERGRGDFVLGQLRRMCARLG